MPIMPSMPNQPDCPNKPYQPPPVNLEPFAYCVDKPGNFIPKHDKKITELLRKVLCEDRHDKAIRAQDAALTAENPRIREQLNTIDICEELKEVKHQEQLEEKRRIQLHENSHDLRKLKLQILAAHTTMYQTQAAALHFQKHRKEYEERKKASAETRVQLQVEDDRGSISLKETNDQKAQFRCDMLEQMAYRQHKLDLERQEKQEDRRRMLETIAQYEKEMEDARQKANQHKKETNLMIEQYLKERQELKQKAREEMLEELRQIEAEQRKMENRQEQDKGEKQRKLAQKMEVCTAMILNLNKIKEDKLYRENQLFDLLVAEKNANEEMSFRKSQIENLQFRKKFNIEYKDHIQKRKMEERAKRLENERICQERIKMLEQMKQEEKEQAAELAIKKKEFLGEIQSMIMQNRQEKFNQQVEERESNKYLADLQKKFDDEVAQERLRLLKSEKPELLKYMQPGSLTPSEIVELGLKRPSEKPT